MGSNVRDIKDSASIPFRRGLPIGEMIWGWEDHMVGGNPVLPGVHYLCLIADALDGTPNRARHAPLLVKDLMWVAPLMREKTDPDLEVSGNDGILSVKASHGGAGSLVFQCAPAKPAEEPADRRKGRVFPVEPPREAQSVAGSLFYDSLARNGIGYGAYFRIVSDGYLQENSGVFRLDENRVADSKSLPAILDACIQGALFLFLDRQQDWTGPAMPFLCASAAIPETLMRARHIHVEAKSNVGDGSLKNFDVHVLDGEGVPLAAFLGLTLKLSKPSLSANNPVPPLRVNIAGSFTTDLLIKPLGHWLKTVAIASEVHSTPYNQVFQQLLDPGSEFARNRDGLNVILLSLEDLLKAPAAPVPTVAPGYPSPLEVGPSTIRLPNSCVINHLNSYETEYLFDEIFVRNTYSRNGVTLADGDCVLDIGANIGMFALYAGLACPNSRIFCFEPAPPAYKALKANITAYLPNARAFNFGISDSDGYMQFAYYPNSSVFSGFQPDAMEDGDAMLSVIRNAIMDSGAMVDDAGAESYAEEFAKKRMETVHYRLPVKKLSTVIRENGLTKIDLLKIDAEKCEAEILSCLDDADWGIIRQIVVEVHDRSGEIGQNIKRLLADKGFLISEGGENLLRDSGLNNIYAVRPDRSGLLEERIRGLQEKTTELADALMSFPSGGLGLQLCLCPPSSAMGPELGGALTRVAGELKERMAGSPLVEILDATAGFPSVKPFSVYSPLANAIGHIPYTEEFFAVLASRITRGLHGKLTPPRKAILLDCDNTLWQGVCGETPVEGLGITEGHRFLHDFVLEKKRQGFLLCLVSKNNEQDVAKVFAQRRDMQLRLEDFVAVKINWQPKSSNVIAIAAELGLGESSFVFLDDSKMECAEVASGCPDVLALEMPSDPSQYRSFLLNIWPLDGGGATEADIFRSAAYAQQAKRKVAQGKASSFKEFLDGLQLSITVRKATPEDFSRLSQLTLRTNQFNFTGVRMTPSEVSASAQEPWVPLCVQASDRFGDYGLVGAVFLRSEVDSLRVSNFMLSCRALGKGIEHRMMAHLGSLAERSGLREIAIPFVSTDRNTPAWEFINGLSGRIGCEISKDGTYRFAAQTLADLQFVAADPASQDAESRGLPAPRQSKSPASGFWRGWIPAQDILTGFTDAVAMGKAIRTSTNPGAASDPAEDTNPPIAATAVELSEYLIGVFASTLGLGREDLSARTSYEDMGIKSLDIVRLTVRLEGLFGKLPKTLLFEHLTIEAVAAYLVERASHSPVKDENAPTGPADNRSDASRMSPPLTGDRDTEAVPADSWMAPPLGEWNGSEIAVIGLGGRYPKSADLSRFWMNLKAGLRCDSGFPSDRWPTGGKGASSEWDSLLYTRQGCFLEDADKFDALFFNISPAEAESLDPQQRLFLEVAWETLEDAGQVPRNMIRDVGVFVGVMTSTYGLAGLESHLRGGEGDRFPDYDHYEIPNRVSYFFDFSGPSMAIDTACSSSLTAIHLACESLRRGECSMALAGGVNIITHPSRYLQYCAKNMLSKQGRCQPFGAGADGFVDGEGVGAVLLKPLAQAIASGDNIHAVILGSSLGGTGKTNGFTVPHPKAQAEVVERSLRQAGVAADALGYVEAHGTGTALGDPIEIQGLSLAFARSTGKKAFCAIGSVKSNIGHLEAAAGIAGLTKVILQLKHRYLVPTLNADQENPNIDFAATPFFLQKEGGEWPSTTLPGGAARISGLSSFGAGGSNAHLTVAEMRRRPMAVNPAENVPILIPLSAKSPGRLRVLVENMSRFLEAGSGPAGWGEGHEVRLLDLAHTLASGRQMMDERLAVVAGSVGDFHRLLLRFLEQGADGKVLFQGNVKNLRSSGDHGEIDSEDRDYFRKLSEKRKWQSLATFWLAGTDLPWHEFPHRKGRKVSLPTYPFKKVRYWLPFPGNPGPNPVDSIGASGAVALHPFVDTNHSTLAEQIFHKVFSTDHPHFRDHLVHGQSILPGADFLEMARAAAELSGFSPSRVFRQVVWKNPLNCGMRNPEVSVRLRQGAEGLDFQVLETTGAQTRLLVRGTLEAKETVLEESGMRTPDSLHAAGIESEEIYRRFSGMGLLYRGRFRSIRSLRCDGEMAIAEVRVDEDGGMAGCILDPVLLDGVLQSAAALGFHSQTEGEGADARVPYSMERMEFAGRLQGECIVRVRWAQGEARQEDWVFDLDVFGSDPAPVLSIRRLVFKRMANPGSPEASGIQYFRPRLIPAPSPSPVITAGPRRILILDREARQSERWFGFPEGDSGSGYRTIIAIEGGGFQKHAWGYVFNPASESDFQRLLASMEDEGNVPDTILDIRPLRVKDAGRDGSEPMGKTGQAFREELLKAATGSLLALGKAFANRPAVAIRLIACFRRSGTVVSAMQEAVSGLFRSLEKEIGGIRFQTMAFSRELSDPEMSAAILSEIGGAGEDAEIVHEKNLRLARRVENSGLPAKEDRDLPIKSGCVYVITGGGGRLGLSLAGHLLGRLNAKVILVGRSEPNTRVMGELDGLRRRGGLIEYHASDVCDADGLASIFKDCAERHGPIRGVFHAAGVIEDGWLARKDAAGFRKVAHPKISGALALDEATLGLDLDFLVFFSSIVAETGNAGQCDYGFANAFMDRFCEVRNAWVQSGARKGKSLSIGWPLWADGGMQIKPEHREAYHAAMGTSPLEAGEGWTALERILRGDGGHWLVLKTQSPVVRNHLVARPEIRGTEGVGSEPAPERSLQTVAATLLSILSDMLKIHPKEVDISKPISDYGFDSITFTDYAVRINKTLGLLVTPAVFFEYQSISEIAAHIHDQHGSEILDGIKETASSRSVSDPKDALIPSLPKASFIPSAVAEGKRTERGKGPIAVIGMDCIFPQAPGLEAYWDLLISGSDAVSPIPKDRLLWPGFAALIQEPWAFDAAFFNISPREATFMDPQQRLFLEVAWRAIESAGYRPTELSGMRVGVFVAASTHDFAELISRHGLEAHAHMATGLAVNMIPNRLSYFLNLSGPSELVNTACSSSLVAMKQAAAALEAGECDLAIVGGCNLLFSEASFATFSKASMLSPSGKCRTFDKAADGYVRGEGVAALVLKRLDQAISDRDSIHALLRAAVVNHGGRSNSLTSPNANAQADLLVSAYGKAAIDIESVRYIECHGTGTPLGDPVEINGLAKAFARIAEAQGKSALPAANCGLGAVKTNIGHLEAAAGMAGVIKAILAIKKSYLPANANFQTLNPYIALSGTPFYILNQPQPWVSATHGSADHPRRAGVSSFGFGGVNAHVVLEEYREAGGEAAPEGSVEAIIFSAKTSQALDTQIANLKKALPGIIEDRSITLRDIAFTLQVGREEFSHRLAFTVSSKHDLAERISDLSSTGRTDSSWRSTAAGKSEAGNVDSEPGRRHGAAPEGQDVLSCARHWALGGDVRWETRTWNARGRRILLPGYPFARTDFRP